MDTSMKKGLLFLKSLFYTANLNNTNMQGLGFKFLSDEIVAKNSITLSSEAVKSQTEYFNTHPFMVNFILGVWFKEYTIGSNPGYYKKIYASALAALGDSFFWHSLRSICFIISGIFVLFSPVYGLAFYLLFFNLFHIYFLFIGFDAGFIFGREVIGWFNRIGIKDWSKICDSFSTLFFGFLLSGVLKRNVEFNIDIIIMSLVLLSLGFFLAKRFDITQGFLGGMVLMMLMLYLRG